MEGEGWLAGGGWWGLELRYLGDLIWALLKFILLNQRHDEHIFMLAHTPPTPTHTGNAHACTCAAQRRTAAAKRVLLSFPLFPLTESSPAVTR